MPLRTRRRAPVPSERMTQRSTSLSSSSFFARSKMTHAPSGEMSKARAYSPSKLVSCVARFVARS
jgi:hypothetical protein